MDALGHTQLEALGASLDGDFQVDKLSRILYSTDASVYRTLPLAVAYPKGKEDLKRLVHFASKHGTSLIPRTAGTSLSGQCVGEGIVVDVSRHMTNVLEINAEERWVRVQPGVIRDELNAELLSLGLQFGPNTSTSNRCMIGGMVGNNSCGTTSIYAGSTRDHTLELKTILSDGSDVSFGDLDKKTFTKKCVGDTSEARIYQHINELLSDAENVTEIISEFPKASVTRRNTGYALDSLINNSIFSAGSGAFNFCKLLAGSEGTLAFTYEIKLNLVPLPPKHKAVVCAHFKTLDESLRSAVIAMRSEVYAVELMDKIVLDCTKENIEYNKLRFFVDGDPAAILAVEFAENSEADSKEATSRFIQALKDAGLGYAYPILQGSDIKKVWSLRSAGLGLLANIPGDPKAVACIEDTAVAVDDLPNYIRDFTALLKKYEKESVYYAHAGAGELHLRPILNLKKKEDRQVFRDLSRETAELVKKYGGSNSGEHGDGRVRGEFVKLMVGEKVYQMFRDIKKAWDPNNVFNPGKIIDVPPMNEELRYEEEQETAQFDTAFDFSATGGILRMAEKCNGSGDCRKTHLSGGTMCPSYMATKDEKDTTRARANTLREVLTRSEKANRFDSAVLKEVMDLCISCKGCSSECPSNVDLPMLKAEFLHQYYQTHGVPMRAKVFGMISKAGKLGTLMPAISRWATSNGFTSSIIKKTIGVAAERSLPQPAKQSLKSWYEKNYQAPANVVGTIFVFGDEFTNYFDSQMGIKALQLLTKLGFHLEWPEQVESGRAQMSKGLLGDAKKLARKNVQLLQGKVSAEKPLIGFEPSAILSFRDEYPNLVGDDLKSAAKEIAEHTYTVEEFLHRAYEKGKVDQGMFSKEPKQVLLHGHCHQKALSSVDHSAFLLSIPENYQVELIPSGCCGMAGSFGYEKEHFDLSMKIGELVLFPAVRNSKSDTIIAAPGTSCRHQILDGTQRKAFHPVEILYDALLDK